MDIAKKTYISRWVDEVNKALGLPPAEYQLEEKKAKKHRHTKKSKDDKEIDMEVAFAERAYQRAEDFLKMLSGRNEHEAIAAVEEEEDAAEDIEDVIEFSGRRIQLQILGNMKKGRDGVPSL